MIRGGVTYDRPVPAKLLVQLETGETWEAKPADWAKFGLVSALAAYGVFEDHLREVLTAAGLLDGDLTEARLNPLRYIAELAIVSPDLLGHEEVADTNADVVAIERTLAAAAAATSEATS